MRIFVCIKQVPDTETKIKIKPDGSGIDEAGVKWIINPYDEYAVEEALKLKEANGGTPTVTVLTVGPKRRVVEALRTAMAMGADDGIAIDCEQELDAFLAAQALSKAIEKEGAYDLIFTGKLAIDDNAASVSQMLAEMLKIPHTTVVSKFTWKAGETEVERETEGGTRELVSMRGPCVVACNKGLNSPRYASLPGIMKAKKKPLKEMALADLGLNPSLLKTKLKNYQLPAEKPAVKMLQGDPQAQAAELVQLLRNEAKII